MAVEKLTDKDRVDLESLLVVAVAVAVRAAEAGVFPQ
jgi:hypothetical protein